MEEKHLRWNVPNGQINMHLKLSLLFGEGKGKFQFIQNEEK
jgi:hypothetical protein